jgi:hypothetical protein
MQRAVIGGGEDSGDGGEVDGEMLMMEGSHEMHPYLSGFPEHGSWE